MNKNSNFLLTAALLILALAIGGAGENFPILQMLLGIGALAVAAIFAWSHRTERLPQLSRWALGLLCAVLLVPLIQLVPLPPPLWHALPGREVVAEIDHSLGLAIWRPLTLDVEGTVRAFVNLVPAAIVFLGCLYLRTDERAKLLLLIAGFALLNAVLGIAQLASGGAMTPFPSAHIGYPLGLFVNRNHNAVFLLLSMPIIAALAAQQAQRSSSRVAYVVGSLAILTIIAIVTVATTSRMALALLPLAFGGSLLLLFFRQSLLRLAVPSTLVLGAIAAIISWVGGFNRNLARFSSLHDARFDYWDDVSWALGHYGIAGTGVGTFIPVYQTAESLSGVSPAILNHAHNDFIELVLEGGLPAIALLCIFFGILAVAAVNLVRKRYGLDRALVSLAAAIAIVLVLIFSLVDYPLRMPAISCTFAVLCACLMPRPDAELAQANASLPRESLVRKRPVWDNAIPRGGALAIIAVLAVIVVQAGISQACLLSDDYNTARYVAPWSTAAHEAAAADALAGSRIADAQTEALTALRLSPIDVVALRTAAMVRSLTGQPVASARLMEIATTLGWRDPFTQLWAIGASEQAREPQKAIERAEALFQQELFVQPSLALLLKDSPDGETSKALVRTLAARPLWRSQFIKASADLPPAYVQKLALLSFELNNGSAPLSLEEAEPLLNRLIALKDLEDARRLWIGSHHGSLVANGNFEELSSRNGADVPSAWDIGDEDLATIAIQVPEFGGHGRALRISTVARSGPILSQRLLLAPGNYDLTYRARSGTGSSVSLRWELTCASSGASETAQVAFAGTSTWQQFGGTFAVPIQDCPIQRLALERPNDMHSQEIWVDDVILKSARR
jgi:O-antigen ligase